MVVSQLKSLRTPGLVVNVLAIRPTICGFKLSRERWIFKSDKNSQHDFIRRGSKAVDPVL
jgi:hypothetical protein